MANNTEPHYLPIWRLLKEKGRAVLAIDPTLKQRIKKAVIQTKWEDVEWNSSNAGKPKQLVFRTSEKRGKTLLTITLKANFRNIIRRLTA